MKNINQINFQGKKVLMRVDFNVPLNDAFQITDETRIRAALPSMNKILADGGSIILMSHLGRPKNGPEHKFSLQHIIFRLSELLGRKIDFAEDCIGNAAFQKSENLKSGEVLLLENLRFYKEEKKGNLDFTAKLAQLGDFYVNDAFGTAHRAHASTSIIAQHFPNKKAAGFLITAELENAQKVMEDPQKPYTAIMGGAKVSDKILIIENLLNKVDNLIIGGGMVYTFFKALGGKIGNSLCEDDKLELAKKLIDQAKEKGVNLMLPIDSVAGDLFSNEAQTQLAESNSIPENWMGLDIGPKAAKAFASVIEKSKTIIWNGPMGVFEMEKFSNGTKKVAQAIANATENGAYSLIGGGDSASAVNQLGFADAVSYVSTGGGALLEYMEGKTLPGVKALED